MADLLLSLGVDDRGVMTGMRGAMNKVKDVAGDLRVGKGVQKGFANLLGFGLGGGAVAASLMAARTAVNMFEETLHPAERSTERLASTVKRAMSSFGRDFSLAINPALGSLDEWITKLEKGRQSLVDFLAEKMGKSGAEIDEINAATRAQQEQEANRKNTEYVRRADLERESRLARLHNDGVRAARAEAELFMLGAKEKYAAAVAAKQMTGRAMTEQLARDREEADLIVQRAEQEAERKKEAEHQRVSGELDKQAEDERKAREEADREMLTKRRAVEDARLDIAGGAVDELRLRGLDDEAKKLDIVLDYRRRLLEIDRLEIEDQTVLNDLRDSAEASMKAQIEAVKPGKKTGFSGGSLDLSSGGAARSIAQVFGTGQAAPAATAQKTNEILREIKGVLQQINSKSGDTAAEYL